MKMVNGGKTALMMKRTHRLRRNCRRVSPKLELASPGRRTEKNGDYRNAANPVHIILERTQLTLNRRPLPTILVGVKARGLIWTTPFEDSGRATRYLCRLAS